LGYWQSGIAAFTLIADFNSEFNDCWGFRLDVYSDREKLSKPTGGPRRAPIATWLQNIWNDDQGQDVAEYAVMLAVILVIVVGTIRLIGSNANNVFSSVGSAIQ
jgi:Flp pilus assembly pilin Flp